MQITGIYKIQSALKPYRVYIGSGINIPIRWSSHLSRLRLEKHHSRKLQNHCNKYGINDLVFSIMEEFKFISKEHLLGREQFYIDLLNPYFNSLKFATSPMLGLHHSNETRIKIGHSNTGRVKPCSNETRLKIIKGHKTSLELAFDERFKSIIMIKTVTIPIIT